MVSPFTVTRPTGRARFKRVIHPLDPPQIVWETPDRSRPGCRQTAILITRLVPTSLAADGNG
jgi:hypothetical protein